MAEPFRGLHQQGRPDRRPRTSTPTRSSPRATSRSPTRRASPTRSSATGGSRRTARSRSRASSSTSPGWPAAGSCSSATTSGPGRRASTRRGRSRAWGVRAILSTSYADIFRSNSLKNGVLPIVVDPATHARLFELFAADPDAELTVDLAEQGVLLPDGSTIDFDIDPFAKQMILAGTDELGYLLSKDAELGAWEAAHPPRIDSLAGAG